MNDGPSVEQDIWQYYEAQFPGQVQVLGPDNYNGSVGQLQTFKSQTGATYPLLLNAATATGGNVSTLYGPNDDYVVINKQGIVRYHSALIWPHGNRYHLNEIRGCVDTLVSIPVGVDDPGLPRGFRLTSAPNPMRASAAIEFTHPLAATAPARIAVFDLAGREVARLVDREVGAGVTRVVWDGRVATGTAPAGVYMIRAEIGSVRLSRRIVVVR